MVYIGKHGAETLQKYKYSGIDRSYLAKYVFQPFWSRFVTIFPLWMPPNMITLTGFFFVVYSALLSYIYNPHLDSPSPNWVHFAHGLLLFLYQTFDAVDGKQARRTSSSSPLGELFDHGCDALTCAFEAMAFGNTFMCGKHTFLLWAISTIPFYCATWEHFFTNTLILPEINGPTEGLMLIYLLHIFTGFIGSSWWARPVKDSLTLLSGFTYIADMPVYDLIIVVFFLSAVCPTVSYNVYNVYKVNRAQNGSLLIAFAMLFPFMALVGGTTSWALLSPSDIMGTQPHLALLGTGFAFGFQVGRMILAHLCDEPKGLKSGMCMPLLLLPLGIANALSTRLLGGVPMINEHGLLIAHCAFTVFLYVHFAVNVIHEITSCLGIHCFRIGRKEA